MHDEVGESQKLNFTDPTNISGGALMDEVSRFEAEVVLNFLLA